MPFNGKHSSLIIKLNAIRIDDQEYTFPLTAGGQGIEALLGELVHHSGTPQYETKLFPDNFNGVIFDDSVESLKTVILIDSGIIVGGKLADDPYRFIRIEGKINE
ncbi:MAG: hypothetical protein FWG13_08590 [Leptospirales bacterium]|nr:hypothetical protein [Leptospirales bacterium]